MSAHRFLIFLIIATMLAMPACSPSASAPALPTGESAATEAAPEVPNEDPVDREIVLADIIFYNGIVLTMEDDLPQAQAIAIRESTILGVGSDDEVLALRGPDTQIINLDGRTVTPGFLDSHEHRITQRDKWGFSTMAEATQDAVAMGWTGLVELMVDEHHLNQMIAADAAGELRTRVNVYLSVNTFDGQPLGDWYQAYQPKQQFSPYLRIAGLKIFIDFDSGRTLLWDQDELSEFVRQRQSEGWQVAVKAIGIRSHELALNAYEYALDGEQNDGFRHRIEHSMAANDAQIARMADRGIIASIEPSFPGTIWYIEDIRNLTAEEGINNMFRWRDYMDAGVFMTASTLNPPEPLGAGQTDEFYGPTHFSPMGVIYRGLTQIGLGGALPEDWMLGRTLSVAELLPMLTINGAYAIFEEDSRGSLVAGKLADLVLLSDNPLALPIEEIAEIDVLMTMIGGRVEYCAEGFGFLCGQGIAVQEEVVEPTVGPVPGERKGMVVIEAGGAITIAVQGPITGQYADYFSHMWNTAQMAADDFGHIDGFSVRLIEIDDRCDESSAEVAAAQLITRHPEVMGVIGPFCSSGVSGSLPVYRGANLVSISGTATRENLSTLFGTGGFNRTVLSQGQMDNLGLSEDYIDELGSVQAFYARYETQYGPLPAIIRPLMAFTYDAVQVLLNAIQHTAFLDEDGGMSVELSALAGAVRHTEDFRGLTGSITFDNDGDRVP